jgi:hypothetical protein
MGKEYNPEDLAFRTFMISMAGVGAFIAVVFLFIL